MTFSIRCGVCRELVTCGEPPCAASITLGWPVWSAEASCGCGATTARIR
jgi:hypothetical protein